MNPDQKSGPTALIADEPLLLTMTTIGTLDKLQAEKYIKAGLVKKINLKNKNISQLRKLSNRHPLLRSEIQKELSARLSPKN